jgi:hypothetical protein
MILEERGGKINVISRYEGHAKGMDQAGGNMDRFLNAEQKEPMCRSRVSLKEMINQYACNFRLPCCSRENLV